MNKLLDCFRSLLGCAENLEVKHYHLEKVVVEDSESFSLDLIEYTIIGLINEMNSATNNEEQQETFRDIINYAAISIHPYDLSDELRSIIKQKIEFMRYNYPFVFDNLANQTVMFLNLI
jgi:hypothetical protein